MDTDPDMDLSMSIELTAELVVAAVLWAGLLSLWPLLKGKLGDRDLADYDLADTHNQKLLRRVRCVSRTTAENRSLRATIIALLAPHDTRHSRKADAFFALQSRHPLTSLWCRYSLERPRTLRLLSVVATVQLAFFCGAALVTQWLFDPDAADCARHAGEAACAAERWEVRLPLAGGDGASCAWRAAEAACANAEVPEDLRTVRVLATLVALLVEPLYQLVASLFEACLYPVTEEVAQETLVQGFDSVALAPPAAAAAAAKAATRPTDEQLGGGLNKDSIEAAGRGLKRRAAALLSVVETLEEICRVARRPAHDDDGEDIEAGWSEQADGSVDATNGFTEAAARALEVDWWKAEVSGDSWSRLGAAYEQLAEFESRWGMPHSRGVMAHLCSLKCRSLLLPHGGSVAAILRSHARDTIKADLQQARKLAAELHLCDAVSREQRLLEAGFVERLSPTVAAIYHTYIQESERVLLPVSRWWKGLSLVLLFLAGLWVNLLVVQFVLTADAAVLRLWLSVSVLAVLETLCLVRAVKVVVFDAGLRWLVRNEVLFARGWALCTTFADRPSGLDTASMRAARLYPELQMSKILRSHAGGPPPLDTPSHHLSCSGVAVRWCVGPLVRLPAGLQSVVVSTVLAAAWGAAVRLGMDAAALPVFAAGAGVVGLSTIGLVRTARSGTTLTAQGAAENKKKWKTAGFSGTQDTLNFGGVLTSSPTGGKIGKTVAM